MSKKNKLYIKFSTENYYTIALVFGFLLGFLSFLFFSPNIFHSVGSKSIRIERGESFNKVVDELYKNGVITNKGTFKISAFITGAETKVRAGNYKISSGLNNFEILELLKKGGSDDQKLVTIQEGIWQFKLNELLADSLNLNKEILNQLSSDSRYLNSIGIKAKTIEGYLLPNTYYFHNNSNEAEVLKKLAQEMDKLFDDKVNKRLKELNMTKHQILTLASIIDGESNYIPEFKRISGVYHNRLKRGMMLQADPTIQYLIRHRKRHNKVYYKDLEIDSPYNTYKYTGLPPGPINNPGKEAILAALYPEEHNFYYFVASGNGDHVFAKTNRQHLLNVQKYRQWRRKNR